MFVKNGFTGEKKRKEKMKHVCYTKQLEPASQPFILVSQ